VEVLTELAASAQREIELRVALAGARRAAEEMERVHREREELLDATTDGVYTIDREGRILFANRAAAELLGYAREELVGRSAADLLVATPAEVAALGDALRDGAVLLVRRALRRKDGTLVPVEINARMLEDGRVLALARDIGERERAEAQRAELGARLLRAQEEERRRIARELHDVTAQDLFAQSLLLSRLAQPGARLDRRGRATLAEARALGERALRDLRTQAYLLHPPLLDELGLAAALEWLVEGFARRSGIAVELAVDEAVGRLPGAVELALFRVAQEGLGNVHRHAGSATARVALARDRDSVTLRVEDRGRGLAGTPEGVGIAGMRERLAPLGGHLALASSEQGTTLTAVVPLPN
jgi:PAS domain S-box-containing protein